MKNYLNCKLIIFLFLVIYISCRTKKQPKSKENAKINLKSRQTQKSLAKKSQAIKTKKISNITKELESETQITPEIKKKIENEKKKINQIHNTFKEIEKKELQKVNIKIKKEREKRQKLKEKSNLYIKSLLNKKRKKKI